jgi:hypothetical protein
VLFEKLRSKKNKRKHVSSYKSCKREEDIKKKNKKNMAKIK